MTCCFTLGIKAFCVSDDVYLLICDARFQKATIAQCEI